MAPKPAKEAITVVDICSSDEDDGGAGGNSDASSNKPPSESETGPPEPPPMDHHHHSSSATTTPPTDPTSEHRSFWKAGSYAVDPSTKPSAPQGHCRFDLHDCRFD